MTEPQGVFEAAFDSTNAVLNLQRVSAAPAWTAKSTTEINGIINDVFDPTTNTIRYVEV